jgi:hypothetical protein
VGEVAGQGAHRLGRDAGVGFGAFRRERRDLSSEPVHSVGLRRDRRTVDEALGEQHLKQ